MLAHPKYSEKNYSYTSCCIYGEIACKRGSLNFKGISLSFKGITVSDIGLLVRHSFDSSSWFWVAQAIRLNYKTLKEVLGIFKLCVYWSMIMSDWVPWIIFNFHPWTGQIVWFEDLNKPVKLESGTSIDWSKYPETLSGPFHPSNLIISLQYGLTCRVSCSYFLQVLGPADPLVQACT